MLGNPVDKKMCTNHEHHSVRDSPPSTPEVEIKYIPRVNCATVITPKHAAAMRLFPETAYILFHSITPSTQPSRIRRNGPQRQSDLSEYGTNHNREERNKRSAIASVWDM